MIAAAIERGEAIPKALLDRPEVWPINRAPWDCFWTLANSRPLVSTGMGALHGRLAYTEISRWAYDHGEAWSQEALDDFVWLVQQMDGEWLKLNQIKLKTK